MFNLQTSMRSRKKTKIKVKLPDRTNYQMVPFRAGNNEDYVIHIITMHCLLEHKETEDDMAKAFKAVVSIKDEKLGPLLKHINMSKVSADKEAMKLEIDSVKEEKQKAGKEAQTEIVKAYKLICVYFVGKA